MANSTTTVAGIQFLGAVDRGPLLDQLTSALAVNTSSLSVVGGGDALSRGIVALLDAYRKDPVAGALLSAARSLSVEASSTTTKLTLVIGF